MAVGTIDTTRIAETIRRALVDAGLTGAEVSVTAVDALSRQSTGKLRRLIPLPSATSQLGPIGSVCSGTGAGGAKTVIGPTRRACCRRHCLTRSDAGGLKSMDAFEARRKSLEEEFFAKQNETLKQKLKSVFERQVTRESLKAASGISNDAVLDMLLALSVTNESMAAFSLFPLVAVAWADGKLDDREREALVSAAREQGIDSGTPAALLLDEWLRNPPRPDGVKAWYAYTKELNKTLDAAQRRTVRDELCRRTRAVAEASGGFLGFGNKVSAEEKEILQKLSDAFDA